MAITLNPTVPVLGIMAPVLGPWFSLPSVFLPPLDPAGKLGMTLTLPPDTAWLPPATGLMSLYLSSAGSPPPALAVLQNSDGEYPFPDGRLVVLFRLLPEVEARLDGFAGLIPPADDLPVGPVPTIIGAPSRPRVRSFALVLPDVLLAPGDILSFFENPPLEELPGADAIEKLESLGLVNPGGIVANASIPMSMLKRPGGVDPVRDKLVTKVTGDVELWAFDRRGRAIDPGAVACWWSWLLNEAVGPDPAAPADPQLLAPFLAPADYPQDGGQPVVAPFDEQRTVHLVNAHEGPLGAPFLNDRLRKAGGPVTENLIQVSGADPIVLNFQPLPPPGGPTPPDNPPVDNAPRARVAVLPTGSYARTATVWPGGAVHAGLTRDFVRVGVVEEESLLVGVTRRDSRLAFGSPEERRRSAQNRPSTRINVSRTADDAGVLLATGAQAGAALLAVPDPGSPARLVLGLADTAWGTATAPPAPPGPGPLPNTLSSAGSSPPAAGEYRVRALTGGSSADDHQLVLVEVNLGAPAAAAWVRSWPQGFDVSTGLHFPLTGGAGRADGAGLAFLVMVLPPGQVDLRGLLGMDLLVVLLDGGGNVVARRYYADRRFERPDPVGGSPAAGVAGNWVVCEAGLTGSGPLPAGAVPPGAHVVNLSGSPAIVDRTSLPAAAWDTGALINRLRPTDIVSLTTPAFGSTPDRADPTGRPLPRTPGAGGSADGRLDTIVGNRLHRLDRTILGAATASSVPYALLDRLEVAGARISGGTAVAALGSVPPVPWMLEPDATFFLGHPGVPSGIETHGTGVALSGAPAVAVAEYVRERTAGLGFAPVQGLAEPVRSAVVQCELAVAAEAAIALPVIPDDPGPGPVVAILRTSALGMEGFPGVGIAATQANVFPLSQHEADLEDWLDDRLGAAGPAGAALRAAAGGPIDSMTRALDRRIMTAAFGASEVLTTLLAAIDRAQDFIYLETPGVDRLAVDGAGENRQLWQRLLDRMAARKGLRLALCVPSLLSRGTPKRHQEVRDHCLMEAVDEMRSAAGDRFALFSPGAGMGRAIRFASTSVVVDDVIAITGTTHLWRRGLSWDSSLAAAVFDERLDDGRPLDVRDFRVQLMADRLGIPAGRLPADPAELVNAIRKLDAQGSERLSTWPIIRPSPAPPNGDIDIWNPDGAASGLTLASVAILVAAAVALTDTTHAIVEG